MGIGLGGSVICCATDAFRTVAPQAGDATGQPIMDAPALANSKEKARVHGCTRA